MRRYLPPARLATLVVAALFLVPILTVVAHILLPADDTFRHLAATVLPRYVANSLILLVGVGAGTLVLGISTARLVTAFDFPGRRLLEWALVLPLAVPTYVIAYAYTDFFSFSGPLQSAVREIFALGPRDFRLPPIRSLGGAVMIFSFVLYPYVYLICRAAFLEQSVTVGEAARTLGATARQVFFRVTLPMARPAAAAGVSLALMETLADYGAVSLFGVQTFTTGIYRAWFSMGDQVAAAQLSTMLLGFVLLLMALEAYGRRSKRYHQTDRKYARVPRRRLTGRGGWWAVVVCALPVFFGFLLPAAILAKLTLAASAPINPGRYFSLVGNTVTLGLVTGVIGLALALIVAYGRRVEKGAVFGAATRLASLGYAIPGSVIAVGVLIEFTAIDNFIDRWAEAWFGVSTGLLLTGSIAAMVFAYLVRFMAIAVQPLDAGLARVTPNMDAAARTLGAGPFGLVSRVHLPLIRRSLLTALLLLIVEVMKELPATLIMRPFNFDTLAVTAYNFASDERLAEAALPALTIVGVGLVPVILLSRLIAGRDEGGRAAGDEDGAVPAALGAA